MPVRNLRDGTIKVHVADDGASSPAEVTVTLEEGNLSWSEPTPVDIVSHRGTLHHARKRIDGEVSVSFSVLFETFQDPNSASVTLYEILTGTGAASAYLSNDFGGVSDAYSVRLEFTIADPEGGTDEVIDIDFFHVEEISIDEGDPFTELSIEGVAPAFYVDSTDHVTNGTFASDTAWAKGTNWQIAAGVASQTTPTASSELSQNVTGLNEGVTYTMTFTVAGRTAGTLTSGVNATNDTHSANGTFTLSTTPSSGAINVVFTGDGTWDGNIDNVTLISASPLRNITT